MSPPPNSPHRAALITGASSGIGEEIAKRLARAGHDLVLVARREDRLRALGDSVAREHGVRATAIGADLADPSAPGTVARRVRGEGIEVELLVNNAGYAVHGAVVQTPERAELDMLQVNVMALVHLTKLFLPGMVARGRGRVLNVASTAAFIPGPFMAGYYASKAFVVSWSEALASELRGTGVTVTALCPGPTATGFAEAAGVGETGLFRSGVMSAAEVADAAVAGMTGGKPLVIAGARNKLLVFSTRLAPRRALTAIARRLNDLR
jgi:uncharacterized protein